MNLTPREKDKLLVAMAAEGSIDHVQNDPRVIEVYLGR